MLWARVRNSKGENLTGVTEDGFLYPRTSLGSNEAAGEAIAMADVTLLAPCEPSKFIGLWNNFHAVAEKQNLSIPEHPLFFLKPSSSLAGLGAKVVMPEGVGRVIFEGELGIVIGQTCFNASMAEAEAAILGYTCINDFTALQVLNSDPSFPQWTRAKGYDGFEVVGPVIATGLDWRSLTIQVNVNGRQRQSYPASDMIKSPIEIVHQLSRDMKLILGDVIACGTSIGTLPVRAGQEVEVVIEGIGGVAVTMATSAD